MNQNLVGSKNSLIFVISKTNNMIIDIIPQVRKATQIECIAMELYNDEYRYVFMRGDVEFSVQFTEKTLSEFIPKRSVSEMLVSWYNGLVAEWQRFQTAVETRQHPLWTTTQKDPNYKGFLKNYEMIIVPYALNDREVKEFEGYANRAKEKLKPITFWRIEK